MKATYITTDAVRAEGLKRQLAELSPETDLDIRARAADARPLLTSGVVDVVLTDTRLSDDDASGLLADLQRHNLPLVVLVTADQRTDEGSYGGLYANADDYVWSYDAAGTNRPFSVGRVARDLSVAMRRAVERRRAEDRAGERPLCTAYIGSDDRVRTALESAPGVQMTPDDGSQADVVVIDASPYDAISLVRTLRESAPEVPTVLLCHVDTHDSDDVAMMLGVDRVLVKAGDWLARLLPVLRAVARSGSRGAQDVGEPAAGAGRSALSLAPASGPDPDGLPIASRADHGRSGVRGHRDDLPRPVFDNESERARDAKSHDRAGTGSGRGWRALTMQEPPEWAAERPRCEALERQPADARVGEAGLTSRPGAESPARPQAAAGQLGPDLARRRVEFDDVERWLKDARNELRQRSSLVELVRAQSGIARRKTQLVELAVGVVTELDAIIREAVESIERAARALRPDPQPDRVSVVTELDSLIREMTETTEHAARALLLDVQLHRARRAAGRARDIAHHFLLFSRWQARLSEPTDLNTVIRDFEPTLKQLVGPCNELLLRIEPTTGSVSLGSEPISRLLISMALLCRDALPIGGQIVFETENVEMVPSWDPSLSRAEPLPFVRVSATIRGHAPRPLHVTPFLESLARECDGHCDEFTTEEPSTGLNAFLPRDAGGQQVTAPPNGVSAGHS